MPASRLVNEKTTKKMSRRVRDPKKKGVNKKDAEDKARNIARRNDSKKNKKKGAEEESSAEAIAKEQVVKPKEITWCTLNSLNHQSFVHQFWR